MEDNCGNLRRKNHMHIIVFGWSQTPIYVNINMQQKLIENEWHTNYIVYTNVTITRHLYVTQVALISASNARIVYKE